MTKGTKLLILMVVFAILTVFLLKKLVSTTDKVTIPDLTRSTPYPTIPEEDIIINYTNPASGMSVNYRNTFDLIQDLSYMEPQVISLIKIVNKKDNNNLGTIKVTESPYFDDYKNKLDLNKQILKIDPITIGEVEIYQYEEIIDNDSLKSYALIKDNNLSKQAIVEAQSNLSDENSSKDLNIIVQSLKFD